MSNEVPFLVEGMMYSKQLQPNTFVLNLTKASNLSSDVSSLQNVFQAYNLILIAFELNHSNVFYLHVIAQIE